MGLAGSLTTLDYVYLSLTYGIRGKLKIRRKQFHGVRFPLPTPSIPFICNYLRAGSDTIRVRAVQIRYSAHPIYLNNLRILCLFRPFASLRPVGFTYAQLRFAWRINGPPQAAKPEGIYVMERTFKVSWIPRHGLNHCDFAQSARSEVNS
jgi:hypothetical protein